MRPRSRLWRPPCSGTGSSPVRKPGVEVLKGLLKTDLGWVELPHGCCQSVFGEVVGADSEGAGQQLHRADRRLIVTVGEHVDVGVCHPFAVNRARFLGKTAIAETPILHQETKRFAKGPVTFGGHRIPRIAFGVIITRS
jgi:hypothetical protein